MDDSLEGASGDSLRREVAELKRRVERLEATLRETSSAAPPDRPEPVVPLAPPLLVSLSKAPPESASFSPAPARVIAGSEEALAASSPQRAGRPSALESRIGAQLFNRVGIFAVLAAAAWFLKLAIDRAWLGPGLRVAVGLAVAMALAAWSERFRRAGSIPFSYTLKALGSGIAYLSLWACFALYHLLPSGVILAAMVAVTLTNAVLAWGQNSELLAALALAGALATPALLSTGGNHESFLFCYLLLLDLGALALVALRSWPRLALGAFGGTTVYYFSWWIGYGYQSSRVLTGLFLALFFALFTATPFFGSLRWAPGFGSFSRKTVPGWLAAFPVAVGSITFLEAYSLASGSAARSWTAVGLGLVYLLLTVWAPSAGSELFLIALRRTHLGLAAGFFALAALIGFDGYGIALCWLMELAVVIAAAYTWREHPLAHPLRGISAFLLLLALLALLLLRWYDPPGFGTKAFLNADFAACLVGLGVFAAVGWLGVSAQPASGLHSALRPKRPELGNPEFLLRWSFLAGFAIVAFNLVALTAVSLQIALYWRQELPRLPEGLSVQAALHHPAYVDLTYSAWFMLYGTGLMAAGFSRRSAFLRWQALVILTFSIGKVFLFDTSHLTEGYRITSFLGLGILLLAVSFVYQRDLLGLRNRIS